MAWLRRRDEAVPRVLRVDGSRHKVIGAAVRAARHGDVIEIAGGTYAERVVIDKAVELRPLDGTDPVFLTHDDGPLVLRAGATVRDITITAAGFLAGAALVIEGAEATPIVAGCIVGAGHGPAIRVSGGASPALRDCRVESSGSALVVDGAGGRYERCSFTASSDDAVEVTGGATPELAGCTVARPERGGLLVSGSGTVLTLHECLVDQAESHGVLVSDGARAVLVGTTLRDIHDDAVSVSGRGSSVDLTGCTIIGETGTGLSVHAHASAALTDCAFAGVDWAVTTAGRGATATITGGTIEDATYGTVTCADRSRLTLSGVAVRRGTGHLEVSDRATLVAEDVTIEDGDSYGLLVSGGEGRFTRCRVTGARHAGARVIAGRAVFDRCEVSGGRGTGFQLEGGQAELTGCVARDNADSGFALYADAVLTACASYANGEPDDVGIQDGAPVPAEVARAVRAGRPAARRFGKVVDGLDEALAVVRAFLEAGPGGDLFDPAARSAAGRLLDEMADRADTLRTLADPDPPPS